MRVTIRLEDELLREAKRLALESGRSLTALIEDAVREAVARQTAEARSGPVKLPVVGGGGLRPGVDLDDSAALLDLMERHDPS